MDRVMHVLLWVFGLSIPGGLALATPTLALGAPIWVGLIDFAVVIAAAMLAWLAIRLIAGRPVRVQDLASGAVVLLAWPVCGAVNLILFAIARQPTT